MMLRKRSRAAVGSKQVIMAEPQSLTNLNDNRHNKATAASLFLSPRLLVGLSPRNYPDHEAAMSPTSTLETKHFSSSTAISFLYDACLKKTPLAFAAASESKHPKPFSLGILNALNGDDESEKQSSKPDNKMVLFASQLKIQIPTRKLNSSVSASSLEFPSSPIEFGIKNKDTQLALLSPAQRTLSAELPVLSPRVLSARIPVSEMELSEDYTCVISHGPNPRKTHIFDNCILESSGDGFIASQKDGSLATACNCFSMSCCDACKKEFGGTKEIKSYRDEKQTPSECHFLDIILDEVQTEAQQKRDDQRARDFLSLS